MEEKWRELADVKRELAARDLFPGTSGNLSIRVTEQPATFLVTASGKDKRKETAEDYVYVDTALTKLNDAPGRPSLEALLHADIYEATEAGAVLHVHTIANNVISDLFFERGEFTIAGNEIIKAFGLWEEGASVTIPIVKNYADIPALAAECKPHIRGNSGAVLIHQHGITVWAEDSFTAKKQLEAWEFLFQYWLARQSCAPFAPVKTYIY